MKIIQLMSSKGNIIQSVKTSFYKMFYKLFDLCDHDKLFDNVMHFISFNQVEGDYLEFGVWEGFSFISAYKQAENYGLLDRMRFFAFDSFEGLPDVKGIDKNCTFKKGDYNASKEEFLKNLSSRRIMIKDSNIIKGGYDKTLKKDLKKTLNIRKVAGVYVDCDLYESTVFVLDFITDLVQEGTVIMFDDWFCFKANPDKGEQRAVKEWLSKNPSLSLIPFDRFRCSGKSFIVSKKVARRGQKV